MGLRVTPPPAEQFSSCPSSGGLGSVGVGAAYGGPPWLRWILVSKRLGGSRERLQRKGPQHLPLVVEVLCWTEAVVSCEGGVHVEGRTAALAMGPGFFWHS